MGHSWTLFFFLFTVNNLLLLITVLQPLTVSRTQTIQSYIRENSLYKGIYHCTVDLFNLLGFSCFAYDENEQQTYLFGEIQTIQTGVQPYSDTFPFKISQYSLLTLMDKSKFFLLQLEWHFWYIKLEPVLTSAKSCTSVKQKVQTSF